jgi:hypothetical protein
MRQSRVTGTQSGLLRYARNDKVGNLMSARSELDHSLLTATFTTGLAAGFTGTL